MPNKLRSDISGSDLINFFEYHNFKLRKTKGSHMILVRKLSFGRQILVIPKHKNVPRGTLKAIYNQALKYIPEQDLFNEFYSK